MLKVIFPIISLVLLALIVILAIISNKKVREESFSLRRFFPFEALTELKAPSSVLFLCLVAAFMASTVESYILTFFNLPTVVGKATALFLSVSTIFILTAFSINLVDYKKHVICDVLLFVLTSLGSILAFFTTLDNEVIYKFNFVLGIIMGVVGLALLVSLFVPKLKSWMYLEKSEENGKTIYVRPKNSILAIYEWMFIFAHGLNMILLAINGILDLLS